MRRKDKEIQDPSVIESILATNHVIRVAWITEEGPYLLPLNYGYREGRLYIHSAPEGRKIEVSRTHPKVCFEVSDSIQVLQSDTPCGFTTRYRCVLGTGTIRIVTDPIEKEEGLSIIMQQITGKPEWKFPSEMMNRLVILCIEIETLTGKKSKI
ncbi:MAG: pyridoxamine 5'-phosphate oxidase family protein [Spirochaetes bacterium]|nr:pyridoxamine 5'-phosphate oxidase family protein [Spirochaetota bacterium]